MTFLEFLSSLAWPAIVGGVLYYLREPLAELINGIKMLKVKAGNTEIELTRKEVTHALEEMLQDVVSLVGDLGEEEKELYVSIRTLDGRKSVKDLFPNFARDSEEHRVLQSLRDRKLIRPFEGSSWQEDKHPVSTRFAAFVEQIAPDILSATPKKR